MRCFFPVAAHRKTDGSVTPGHNETNFDQVEELQLRCGKCMGCRVHRKQQWTTRMQLELKTHDRACFITMTYDPEHVPEDGSLNVTDWQSFAKRARHELGRFRFYQCGEYGNDGRPHHHAILFGVDFNDRKSFSNTRGVRLDTSDQLTRLWGNGHCTVGDATQASIGYVSGYVTKKLDANHPSRPYEVVNAETGEVTHRRPPFSSMSLKPGLGEPFYRRWKDQIYPRDEIILDGRKVRPPAYFDTLLEREDPDLFDQLEEDRKTSAEEFYAEDTPQKRRAADAIAKASHALRKGVLHA